MTKTNMIVWACLLSAGYGAGEFGLLPMGLEWLVGLMK